MMNGFDVVQIAMKKYFQQRTELNKIIMVSKPNMFDNFI